MHSNLIDNQKIFFNSNKSKEIKFRINQLKKLKFILKDNEASLFEAIYKDFKKSEFETYETELALIYHEINLSIKKLKKWSKPKKVKCNIINFPSSNYIIPEPLGCSLIIGAWNYPFLLSLGPSIASLSAGNTVILKPSEIAINSSNILAKIINSNFNSDYFHILEGGVDTTQSLLKNKFDKIFFTGSSNVGKVIYQEASKNLTPVTLELGGKSPVFVFPDANLKVAVKRIAWGKFLNAGQTCIAPDFVLVHEKIKYEFLNELIKYIENHYSDGLNDNFTQIINQKNFDRLNNLISREKIYYGGITNETKRYISPTILTNISFEDRIMQEEIFGPILPVLDFNDLDKILAKLKELPKPLACYIFTQNKSKSNKILKEYSFGGGCINDTIMHISNTRLPFGGVGQSGFGNYHGEHGFKTFSHFKSLLKKSNLLEPNIKYPPYSKKKLNIIKRVFSF